MPGLAKTVIPAALGGGALLFGDDADAGFLRPAAREAIGYDPTVRGNGFLKLGLARAPDGSGMSTNDRLDTLIGAIKDMPMHEQVKYFTNYIHQKANYEDWGKEMLKADGGARSGDEYKAGLDAFLEDIIERRPVLEPVVTKYAMSGKQGRLSRTSEQAQRQEDNRKRFVHGATNKPRHRRGGGRGRHNSIDDSLLGIALENREQKLNEHMDNLGLAKDPMYDYGSLLPVKQNIVTGESSLAAPEVLRDVMRGILGLGMTPETGIYDPQNLLDVAI